MYSAIRLGRWWSSKVAFRSRPVEYSPMTINWDARLQIFRQLGRDGASARAGHTGNGNRRGNGRSETTAPFIRFSRTQLTVDEGLAKVKADIIPHHSTPVLGAAPFCRDASEFDPIRMGGGVLQPAHGGPGRWLIRSRRHSCLTAISRQLETTHKLLFSTTVARAKELND